MKTACFQTREHWPQMKMQLMLLFVITKLLHFSLGQSICGYNTVCPCNNTTNMCPSGFCCRSSDNTCGETIDYCGAKYCGSQCNTACGPTNDGTLCPIGQCCNILGFCGNTTRYCGVGSCASQCPFSTAKCGPNEEPCEPGACCSTYNYCGVDSSWCGVGNCTSQCPAGICGFRNGGILCPNGDCCNIYGYCGNTSGHCAPGYCLSQCLRVSSNPTPIPISQVPGGTKPDDNVKSYLIAGGSLESVILVICIVIFVCLWLKRRGRTIRPGGLDPTVEMEIKGMPKSFTYEELRSATGDFGDEAKLGKGAFGSVYLGKFRPVQVQGDEEVKVAVKKIKSTDERGEKDFKAEVSIITQLRHRNLIQLHGWCKNTNENTSEAKFLLVYELMPRGSLDEVLFQRTGYMLSWSKRFQIVKDIAAAVDYLHRGWNQQVIHRDIKSSNILLTNEWKAVLGDFGLARLIDRTREPGSTLMAGTPGYMAPEVNQGQFTEKVDVYAFGAVMLEIACGRKVIKRDAPPEQENLIHWVRRSINGNGLLSTVDDRLPVGEDYDERQVELVMAIGLWCLQTNPADRPDMHHVVAVLLGDGAVPDSAMLSFRSDRPLIPIEDLISSNVTNSTVITVNSVGNISSSAPQNWLPIPDRVTQTF